MTGGTEIRLDLNPDELDRLLGEALGVAHPAPRRSTVHYFDTGDRRLAELGLCLGVAGRGRRWEQSLDGPMPGLPVAVQIQGAAPDRTKLPPHGAWNADLHERLAGRSLARVARLRRAVWEGPLRAGGHMASAVVTAVELSAGSRRRRLADLAIDHDPAAAGAVYRRLQELAAACHLRPAARDLGSQIQSFLAERAPVPVKGGRMALRRGATVGEAFEAITGACLDQLLANHDAVQDHQAEGVHQARVALRRLRSCLRLFRRRVPGEAQASILAGIRWLNGFLGPAREWDVFVDEALLPVLAAVPEDPGLLRLRDRSERARAASYEALDRCLADHRYGEVLLGLVAWQRTAAWREGLPAARLEAPLAPFAARCLERMHRRIARDGGGFASMAPAERHALRIRMKRMRYAVEFFGGLYGKGATALYRGALKDLQDILGILNDAATAGRMLDAAGLAAGSPVRMRVEGWYAGRVFEQERHFAAAWSRFLDCDPPWP